MKTMRTVMFGAMFIVGLVPGAKAQVVANWTLNNTLSGTGTPQSTAGLVSLGPGVNTGNFNGGTEYYGQDGWPSTAPDPGTYIQFSISPTSGYELHLTSVVIRMRRSNTGSPAGSGPLSWALRSSRDGYASNLATGSMTHSYANYSIPLSSFTAVPSTVTFRLYGYNTTVSPGGNSRLVLDNISILGITALLPLKFTSIVANQSAQELRVNVGLAQVEAGTRLALEKSLDGTQFSTISSLVEGSNRSTAFYSFIDPTPSKAYYRVKSIDINGLIIYSKIVFIDHKTSSNAALKIRQLVSNELVAAITVAEAGAYELGVFSLDGKLMYKQSTNLQEGNSLIRVALPPLPNAVYVLQVANSKFRVTGKFVKSN